MNVRKEDLIYVGIDLHKETHTAVIFDSWNTKLGEITFANTLAEFPKLIRKVKKYCTENKQTVYGLENAYGYGRALAVWLLERNCVVKDVNTSLIDYLVILHLQFSKNYYKEMIYSEIKYICCHNMLWWL